VVMPRESSYLLAGVVAIIMCVAMAGWTVRPSSVPFTASARLARHNSHSTAHPDPDDPDPVTSSCLAAFSLRFVCA